MLVYLDSVYLLWRGMVRWLAWLFDISELCCACLRINDILSAPCFDGDATLVLSACAEYTEDQCDGKEYQTAYFDSV